MNNELAVIAIKGGRFSEAESMFNADLQADPSSSSFFGLGVCKINMLLDVNRTVEEVTYCFNKALSLAENEDEKQALKEQAKSFLVSVLTQYIELYFKLEEQKKAEATAAIVGLGLTVAAAAIGSGKSANGFTQIASLAVAGAGVGVSLDGLGNLGQIPEIQSYILKTGKELIVGFAGIEVGSQEEFKAVFDSEKIMIAINQKKIEKQVFFLAFLPMKTRMIVLCCIMLHRVYLGKWISGYLFIFTLGGFGIWLLVDLIKILNNSFDPKW